MPFLMADNFYVVKQLKPQVSVSKPPWKTITLNPWCKLKLTARLGVLCAPGKTAERLMRMIFEVPSILEIIAVWHFCSIKCL